MGKNNMRIGFIGCGNMASAIIAGILKTIPPRNIIASDISIEKLQIAKKKLGIGTTNNNNVVVDRSDIIIFAVKPQGLKEVVNEVGEKITENKIVVSIAAGIKTSFIEKTLQKEIPVIRVMPNTPALIKEGMSCICKGRFAKLRDIRIIKKIFRCVGKVEEVQEDMMDAATAIQGSSPAYIFYMAEAMIEAAKELGFSDKTAKLLVVQSMRGSSLLLEKTNEEPVVLRQRVMSKGGTTEAAMTVFEEAWFKSIVKKAISAAYDRSRQLSGG
jgi:pyrroline-5-carboxylate reductase